MLDRYLGITIILIFCTITNCASEDKNYSSCLVSLPSDVLADISQDAEKLCTLMYTDPSSLSDSTRKLWDSAIRIIREKPLLRQVKITDDVYNPNFAMKNKQLCPGDCLLKLKAVLFFSDEKNLQTKKLFVDSSKKLPGLPRLFHFQGLNVLEGTQKIDSDENQTLGLFLSESEQVHISTSSLRDEDFKDQSVVDLDKVKYLVNNVQGARTNTRDSPYAMMMFHTKGRQFGTNSYPTAITEHIRELYLEHNGNFSLWGYQKPSGSIPMAIASHWLSSTSLLTRISGPGVRSWSLVLDRRADDTENLQKLNKLREKIDFVPARTLALSLHQSNRGGNGLSLMEETRLFREVFMGVQIGTFAADWKKMYCIDSSSDRGTPQIEYDENFICYLLIYYAST